MKGWDPLALTEWQAAVWMKERTKCTSKTARRAALGCLNFLERALGVPMHAKCALVASQGSLKRNPKCLEPPVPAVPPSIEVMGLLECLISRAPTLVERIICGFCCCMAYSCLRCSDLLSTRRLSLGKDSLSGQSLLKNKKQWTQWFAPAGSATGVSWAKDWIDRLNMAGLPGPDYIFPGFSISLDSWSPRRAVYSDVARALQAILVTGAKRSAMEAKSITPHSFRHFLVGPGRQLQLQGFVSTEGIEAIGHWERGSSMPAAYDSSAGVTELSTRATIVNALYQGWIPAKDGELAPTYVPSSLSGEKAPKWRIWKHLDLAQAGKKSRSCTSVPAGSSGPRTVAHLKRKRLHFAEPGTDVTVCRWWKCGTFAQPSPFAVFDYSPDAPGFVWCRHCQK